VEVPVIRSKLLASVASGSLARSSSSSRASTSAGIRPRTPPPSIARMRNALCSGRLKLRPVEAIGQR
jgi:hypothetical protein